MQTKLKSSSLLITINSLGAEISSIKDNNNFEYIWQAESEWKRHTPVLFPIVGKLKNNEYFFQNKNYNLSQHGFARDLNFNLIATSENTCTYELNSTFETKKNYPFDFSFQITYCLIENKLTVNYKVINLSIQKLFFSVGAHPAFNCNFNNFYLEFEKSDFLITELENGLRKNLRKELALSDNKLPLSKSLFDDDALVFEASQINKVSLCSKSNNQKITLECDNWPYFGIWSKKDCDKFICLEPWFGIADREDTNSNFERKDGINSLNPNDIFSCEYAITINS